MPQKARVPDDTLAAGSTGARPRRYSDSVQCWECWRAAISLRRSQRKNWLAGELLGSQTWVYAALGFLAISEACKAELHSKAHFGTACALQLGQVSKPSRGAQLQMCLQTACDLQVMSPVTRRKKPNLFNLQAGASCQFCAVERTATAGNYCESFPRAWAAKRWIHKSDQSRGRSLAVGVANCPS